MTRLYVLILAILVACGPSVTENIVIPPTTPPTDTTPKDTTPTDTNPLPSKVPCCYFWEGAFDSTHAKVGVPYDFAKHATFYAVDSLGTGKTYTFPVGDIEGILSSDSTEGCVVDPKHLTITTCAASGVAHFELQQGSLDNVHNPSYRLVVALTVDP